VSRSGDRRESNLCNSDDDGVHWDYAETMDDSIVSGHQNPWYAESEEDRFESRSAAFGIWDKFPEHNRAWFEIEHILPFENMLDIDEVQKAPSPADAHNL
jgi:hypothetical protein